MKTFLLSLILLCYINVANAQAKLDDFGRIVLNTYLPNNINIPNEAKDLLTTKLNQITTNNGMGGSQANPRFIITAKINVGSKDIIAGPPQMIGQNLDITLFIGDAVSNTIFSNVSISLKGVGTNENKALIEAFKTLNPNHKEVLIFLEEGKNKIINYYSTQCDFIINEAKALVNQGKYDNALYRLSLIPHVCEECYLKSLKETSVIYDLKINEEGKTRLSEANAIWTANPNDEGAQKAINLIMQINPKAKSYADASALLKKINEKVLADEKERLRKQEEFEKRQQLIDAENDKQQAEIEKQRINAYREVAVEYVRNQPKVVYRNIYW